MYNDPSVDDPTKKKVTVVLADDHAIIREGLRHILDSHKKIEVVGEARDGHDAVEKAGALMPDVMVMDIAMPGLNGIEATRRIHELHPSVKIVILSMHHTTEHILQALRAGARGYLLKESAGEELVRAIRTVARGNYYYGEGIEIPYDGPAVEKRELSADPLACLSQREREVLKLVVEGNTSAEIAEMLQLSPKTVETYRSRLMMKLGIGNLPALVKFAIRHGVTRVENLG